MGSNGNCKAGARRAGTGSSGRTRSEDVERLRGSVHVEHTLARLGAERLWQLLQDEDYVAGPRRADRRPGGADGEGRAEGDLPERLAGRRRREPRRPDVPRPEPLPVEQRAGPRAAAQQRPAAGRPDPRGRGRHSDPLAGADRRRRRGRLRWAAERVRGDEGDDRSGRGGRALRGPALVREEVRPSRRQSARPDEPVRPHAGRGAARRRRLRRADGARRAHRRAQREAADERRRPGGRAVPDRRAHARGLLPRARRAGAGDRQGAWRRRPTPTSSGSRPRRRTSTRRASSPKRSTNASPASCSPTTARRRSTGARTSTTSGSRGSSASWPSWATASSS